MKKLELKQDTIRSILEKRARGWSYASIAKQFHIGSREMVRLIIERNRKKPEFKELSEEIDKTWAFLKRKF